MRARRIHSALGLRGESEREKSRRLMGYIGFLGAAGLLLSSTRVFRIRSGP